MKIQFDFSTAELAEVAGRTVDRSPLVRRWRVRNGLAGAVIAGLLVFAFLPGDATVRVVAAVLVGLMLLLALVFLSSRQRANARTQAFYRERLGGDGPFPCEVELTSTGVVSRQLGHELHHAWSQVVSVSEVPGGIEFIYRPIGSLLVRDRAFPNAELRTQFLSLARSFVPTGENVPPSGPVPAPSSVIGPSERDYFVAWLSFFVCVTLAAGVLSTAIGAGSMLVLRPAGIVSRYGVYAFAGVSFVASACVSYLFFRLFVKRLVSRMQARLIATA